MAFRIFVGLLLVALFGVSLAISPPDAMMRFGAGVETWGEAVLLVGLPPDILIEINAMGLGVLTAGVALKFSPLGGHFGEPAEAASSDRIAWAVGTRNAAFESMTIFGVCCLLSTLAVALDRQIAASERDLTITLLASNLTAAGLVLAMVFFLGSTIRIASLANR